MTFPKLDLMGPGMTARSWNEAEILGAGAWLFSQSPKHREMPLHVFSCQLLSAIEHRQFLLGSRAGEPLFYLSWAKFDVDAEARFLQHGAVALAPRDWDSGGRLWIIDWIAPFGHTATMAKIMRRQLFRYWTGRMICRRSGGAGERVRAFRGYGVAPAEARRWLEENPLAVGKREGR